MTRKITDDFLKMNMPFPNFFKFLQLNFIYLSIGLLIFVTDLWADDAALKIGVSVPLSGEAAIYGEDIRDFLNFANKQIAKGRYQLIFEDDKCNAKDATSVAQKLITIDKIKYAIGYACSSTILSTAQFYERAKIPVIVVFASSPRIRDLGEYIFRTYPSDALAAQLFASTIRDKYSRIGILSEETDYAQDLKEELVKQLSGSSTQVVEENYLPNSADYRTVLLKLKSKNPEALFINPQAEGTFANIMQQLAVVNWTPQIYGAYWPGSPSVQKLVGEKLNGTIYVDTPALSEMLNSNGETVLKSYQGGGGKIRTTEAVFATVYEGFRALHQAIESKEDVKDYLLKTKWDGIFGPWHFDEKGEIAGISLMLKKINNGKPEKFQK